MTPLRLFSVCVAALQCQHLVHATATYRCILEPIGAFETRGEVTFTQEDGSNFVVVEANVQNLPAGLNCPNGNTGLNGIHVHELGILDRDNGGAAGPHFNPLDEEHGCYDPANPTNADRKAGDLGNLDAGSFTANSYLMSLDGFSDLSVVARSVIVHECEDSCERSPEGDASAGARVAQCVIGLVEQSPTVPIVVDGGLEIGVGTAVAIAFCAAVFGALCTFTFLHGQKGLSDPFQDSEGMNRGQQGATTGFIQQDDNI